MSRLSQLERSWHKTLKAAPPLVAAIITIFINDWKLAIIALVGPLLFFARDRTRLT